MQLRINLPSSSVDYRNQPAILINGGKVTFENVTEDEGDAMLGLVAKAIAARNPTAPVGVNPLDRIAAAIEVFASKVPSAEQENRDSHYKQELDALKAKLLVEQYLEELAGIHSLLFTKAFLKSVDDLVRDMSHEYKQVRLGDALEALSKAMAGRTYEQVVHDKDNNAKAQKAFDRAEKDTLIAIAKPIRVNPMTPERAEKLVDAQAAVDEAKATLDGFDPTTGMFTSEAMEAFARAEAKVCKPTCIKHGLEICKECSDISATRNVPPSAY